MIKEFRSRIEKSTSPKRANKILKEALKKYGFFSKEYGELLTLCWEKYINGGNNNE